MRLQEVYFLCKTALEMWPEIEYVSRQSHSGDVTYFQIKNAESVSSTLITLEKIDPLKSSIQKIYDVIPEIRRGKCESEILEAEKEVIDVSFSRIYDEMQVICQLCVFLEQAGERIGFDIKLPPNLTLKELSRCVTDIDKILSICPILRVSDGQVSLDSADVGSFWLTFTVFGIGTVEILNRIAALVSSAVIIRSQMLTLKEQEQRIRTLGLANDLLETTVKTNTQIIKAVSDQEIEKLSTQYSVTDNESRLHLKHSLKLLSDWMSKGMEVYASVGEPPEVKAVFPSVERQKLPENVIKLLDVSNENGNND